MESLSASASKVVHPILLKGNRRPEGSPSIPTRPEPEVYFGKQSGWADSKALKSLVLASMLLSPGVSNPSAVAATPEQAEVTPTVDSLSQLQKSSQDKIEHFKLETLRVLVNQSDVSSIASGLDGTRFLSEDANKLALIEKVLLHDDSTVQEALADAISSLKSDSLKLELVDKILKQPNAGHVRSASAALSTLKDAKVRDAKILELAGQGNIISKLIAAMAVPSLSSASLRDQTIVKLGKDADEAVRIVASWHFHLISADTEKSAILRSNHTDLSSHSPEYAVRGVLSITNPDLRDDTILDLMSSQKNTVRYLGGMMADKITNAEKRDSAIASLLADTTAPFKFRDEEVSFRKLGLTHLPAMADRNRQTELLVKALEDSNADFKRVAASKLASLQDGPLRLKWIRTMLADQDLSLAATAAGTIRELPADGDKAIILIEVAKLEQAHQQNLKSIQDKMTALDAAKAKLDPAKAEHAVEILNLDKQLAELGKQAQDNRYTFVLNSALPALESIESDQFKVPLIEALLVHEDANVSGKALKAIASVKEDAAKIKLIQSNASNTSYSGHSTLSAAVQSVKDGAERTKLIQALTASDNIRTRELAAYAVQFVPDEAERLVLLKKLAADPEGTVSSLMGHVSADSLARGQRLDGWVDHLAQSSDPFLRLRAAQLLTKVSDEALKMNLTQNFFYPADVKKATPEIRAAALQAVSSLTSPEFQTKILWDAGNDNSPQVRAAVPVHLKEIMNIGLRNELIKRLCQDEDIRVRVSAAEHLNTVSSSVREQCRESLMKEADPTKKAQLAWAMLQSFVEAN